MTPAKPQKPAQKRVKPSAAASRPHAGEHAAAERSGTMARGAQSTRSLTKKRGAKGLSADTVSQMFARFKAANPEPKGELEHTNPFTLLVAVVLSAQATDAGVNKATRGLFAAADNPEKMLALGEERVREHIKTIGLFRNKAKNVIALSEQLIARHGGDVPRDRDALEALAGVGRKTANVVLNMAFGEATVAVDTHLFRLANRLGLAPGKTPNEVEQKMLKVVPPEYLLHAHHWLILHGRYVCKAQRPLCGTCVIADLCTSADKVLP